MKTLKIFTILSTICATILLASCSSTRKMNQRYIDIENVSQSVDKNGNTILKIDGEYIQSRYGFNGIKTAIIQDEMYISGIAEMGAKDNVGFSVIVPPEVNVVYLSYKEIWRRN